MSLNIFRSSLNEIEYIKDAINNVKGEEDSCCFNEEAIKKFLYNDDNWFYIATIDNKVVAYAIAYVQRRLDTTKNMICLYEIGTLRCWRKKGIAKRIINKIIEDGKLNDVMKIWIPTNTSNITACALYRSIGAQEPEVKDEIIYNYRYYSDDVAAVKKDKIQLQDEKIAAFREQVKKLKQDKKELIVQLVDYEELKSENERLKRLVRG